MDKKTNSGFVPNPADLEIDRNKCDIIRFFVENEMLDKFAENEHFYYWIFKSEKKLSDIYKFINDGALPYEHSGKLYDLNSFDGISELIIDVKDVRIVDGIFSGPPVHRKREFILRYSKTYKRIEYYTNLHSIEKNKDKTKYYIRHHQEKYFSINEKNHVRIYPNRRMVRYISNKSVLFYKPSYHCNQDDFYLKANRRLLNLHFGNEIYKSDEKFYDENRNLLHLSNKSFKNCSSINDVLKKVTKGKPVPKVLLNKLDIGNVISLYHLVDYDEMDKIIKFLYEYYDFFNELNYFNVLENYFGVKFGILLPNKLTKQFDLSKNDSDYHAFGLHSSLGQIRDYIRMSVTLGKQVNMNIRSHKRLVSEHDELVRKITSDKIPKIKVHRSYPTIESAHRLMVEKIVDKNRLLAESEIQKHCVKTYAQKINRGLCCIYSIIDKEDGMRYTIEVVTFRNKAQKRQIFVLSQIRGKFNSNPRADVMHRVNVLLTSNGIFISQKEAMKSGFLFTENKNRNSFEAWVMNVDNLQDQGGDLPF